MRRLVWLSIFFLALVGCESGTSSGPAAIAFTPAPAPSGQGFVALYSPPVDVGPYPNDIYNPVAAGTAMVRNTWNRVAPMVEAAST